MKSKAYLEELRNKSVDELSQELVSAKKELFNLRFQNATNQLKNTARITEVRKHRQNSDCDFQQGRVIREGRGNKSWKEILEKSVSAR